jgi:hypothetical protein
MNAKSDSWCALGRRRVQRFVPALRARNDQVTYNSRASIDDVVFPDNY